MISIGGMIDVGGGVDNLVRFGKERKPILVRDISGKMVVLSSQVKQCLHSTTTLTVR